MVVAHQRQHAAIERGSGVIGVAEHVARAVDARPLAVPDAEHAVIGALAAQFGLLGAPQRRRREVFIDARLEQDVLRLEEFPGALEGVVDPAERRAAIARHIPGRVQPARRIHGALGQRQAHDGLGAGDVDAALGKIVFVVEADLGEGHGHSPFMRKVKLTETIRQS